MNETQMLTLAAALVATMFGLLCTVIGWVGSRALNAIDDIRGQLARIAADMHQKLTEVASELHERLNGTKDELQDRVTKLGERVTRLEAGCHVHHSQDKD
jgi:uncharacterized protein YoxC